MFSSPLKTIICLAVMATLFTGCATKTLMTKDNKTYTRTNKVTLIEDQVVAFGKPAQPLPNLPVHSLVIAGQQKKLCPYPRWASICQLDWETGPKKYSSDPRTEFLFRKK